MVADNYPDGYDVVWLASDRLGQLAAFITAGVGPIPIWALDYPELSILDIEDSICGLPKSSGAVLTISAPRPDSFLELAERGLFVYDWHDVHRIRIERSGMYELAAFPRVPLLMDALPVSLKIIAKSIQLAGTDFFRDKQVALEESIPCQFGEKLS
jgi:hypothetical protein